jgi:NAD(P)-dependent dehydrogenase (short-subunit alcohol dehydrogenase family)
VLNVAGDIASPATAERIVLQGLDRFGRIDTLVNNAGIFIAKPFVDHNEEDYASIVAINLGGFFRLTKRVAAEMLRQGSGHIVQITTSLVAHPNSSVPAVLAAMTKGGLNAATRSLAIEYAARNIRVNAVSPGIIKTPMHAAETHEFLSKLHPVGRMGESRDIVDAVLYPENASFVTGDLARRRWTECRPLTCLAVPILLEEEELNLSRVELQLFTCGANEVSNYLPGRMRRIVSILAHCSSPRLVTERWPFGSRTTAR